MVTKRELSMCAAADATSVTARRVPLGGISDGDTHDMVAMPRKNSSLSQAVFSAK